MHTTTAFYVHLVNYAPEPVAHGVRIELLATGLDPAGCTFAAPMEDRRAAPISVEAAGPDRRALDLPSFGEYGVVTVNTQAASK